MITGAEKICRKCGSYERQAGGDCAPCARAIVKRWRTANPEREREVNRRSRAKHREAILARKKAAYVKDRPKRRERDLRKKYGITHAEYLALLAEQGGKCAICQEGGRLVVDHCHSTGAVRGLLCGNCNLGIGQFSDNPALLLAASTYVVK